MNRRSQLLAAILVNAVYEMQNYPIVLLNIVISPLSFLLLIVFVSRGTLIGVGIMGGFIMTMFSAGMSLQTDLSHLKNDFKLQDMIVSSPTTQSIYMFGMAIAEIIYSLPALLTLSALSFFFVKMTLLAALGFVSILILMFLMSVFLGFLFSTLSSDIVQSFAFSRMLSTLFTTIPPIYYPITYIPLPIRYIAYLSPTTYAAQLSQNLGGYLQLPITIILLSWMVLIGLTILLFLLSTKRSKWRE
jgi:ABC-2 type transport system permease protein